ncbi:hypothetical protein HDU97_008270 [Phlyctochytrium planicorne]|nr:hypothetical protein HDU97_008270 [Phlyctochytrium planicorne]
MISSGWKTVLVVLALSVVNVAASVGFGYPCSERSKWDSLKSDPEAQRYIRGAARILEKPFPAWSDDHYLLYFKTGDRVQGQQMQADRVQAITFLAVAECVEWKGRFLNMLNDGLKSVATQPAWTMAASDPNAVTFYGKDVIVDLQSSEVGAVLSQAHFLLESVLKPDTVAALATEIRKRSIQPMLDVMNKKRKPYNWVGGDNNWNAVCWSGVTFSYLAFAGDDEERAKFVDFAVTDSLHYRNSFLPDGFGMEGISYFSYGFGYYSFLRETLYYHTKLDVFANDFVAKMAMFPLRFTMRNSVSAQLGDAKYTAPSTRLVNYIRWAFGMSNEAVSPMDDLPNVCLQFFKRDFMEGRRPGVDLRGSEMETGGLEMRSVFGDAATVVLRDLEGDGKASRMDVTFKNGGNLRGHSHNDVGAYAVQVDGVIVTGDPGGPSYYTASSFGKDRYKSPLFNSIGHPVPLFRKGSSFIQQGDAIALLDRMPQRKFDLATAFTTHKDTVRVDLSRAYFDDAVGLLTRTVVYTRGVVGTTRILDVVDGSRGKGLFDGWDTPIVSHGNITIDGFGGEDSRKMRSEGVRLEGDVIGSIRVVEDGKVVVLKFRIVAGVGEGWFDGDGSVPTLTSTSVASTKTKVESSSSSSSGVMTTAVSSASMTGATISSSSTTAGTEVLSSSSTVSDSMTTTTIATTATSSNAYTVQTFSSSSDISNVDTTTTTTTTNIYPLPSLSSSSSSSGSLHTVTYPVPSASKSISSSTHGIVTSTKTKDEVNANQTSSVASFVQITTTTAVSRPRCKVKTDSPRYRRRAESFGKKVGVRLQLLTYVEFGNAFQRLSIVADVGDGDVDGKVGVLVEYF